MHNQSFLEVTLRESRHAANQLPPKLLLATSADLTGSRQHVCTAQEQSTVYTLCWNSDLQVAPPRPTFYNTTATFVVSGGGPLVAAIESRILCGMCGGGPTSPPHPPVLTA